jgi:N-acetyl-D-muramate 6-phosphate phosphatase
MIRAILFDLDGTLIDSSDDLAGAMNAVRAERGEPLVPIAQLRPHTARGARSMIESAYGFGPEHAEYKTLRTRFLHHYANASLVHTHVWPGMWPVLYALKQRSIRWGIVTNKATRFTHPIVHGLNLTPHVLVCGDTTGKPKPAPEPMHLAATCLNVLPAQIAYVGDAISDVQAAHAVGMFAVGAGYSHFVDGFDRAKWNADAWVESPLELLSLVRS